MKHLFILMITLTLSATSILVALIYATRTNFAEVAEAYECAYQAGKQGATPDKCKRYQEIAARYGFSP